MQDSLTRIRHPNFKDLTGQKFGRLTVINYDSNDKHNQAIWNCKCDCGNDKLALGKKLRNGEIVSCTCYQKERIKESHTTHGKSYDAIYKLWRTMMARCYLKTCHCYKRYGGRGIKVSDEWHNFEIFYNDMGDRPHGKTLHRKDNNGNYCKENCVWATYKTQAAIKTNTVYIEHNGEKHTLYYWAEKFNISSNCLYQRIFIHGWNVEKALITPVKK